MDELDKISDELSNKGFGVKKDAFMEQLMYEVKCNGVMLQQVLTRLIALEQRITTGKVDDVEISRELGEVVAHTNKEATKMVTKIYATLLLNEKEKPGAKG